MCNLYILSIKPRNVISSRIKIALVLLYKGRGIVLGILFFFFREFFFFLVGGGFGAVQAPFWGKPRGERQVRAGFSGTYGGGFRAVQAPFWGNQW